jgi:hypothetical protein
MSKLSEMREGRQDFYARVPQVDNEGSNGEQSRRGWKLTDRSSAEFWTPWATKTADRSFWNSGPNS